MSHLFPEITRTFQLLLFCVILEHNKTFRQKTIQLFQSMFGWSEQKSWERATQPQKEEKKEFVDLKVESSYNQMDNTIL